MPAPAAEVGNRGPQAGGAVQPQSQRTSTNVSPAGTPGPSMAGPNADPSKVTANWKTVVNSLVKIFAVERSGRLNSKLALTVRQVIADRPRDIVAYWASVGAEDPLLNIPVLLNPSLDYRDPESKEVSKAIITPAVFAAKLKDARALVKSKIDSGEIVPQAAPAASVPAVPAQRPAAPNGAQASGTGANIQTVVPPPGILSIGVVSHLVRNEPARRNWIAESPEIRGKQWTTSVQWWTEYQNRQKQIAAAAASTDRAAAPGAAGGPGGMSIQSRPFNLQPPPVPTENEDDRRRRKFREYLQEQAPGMELEWGTNAIMSDVLDSFVDDAVRGAIRLAKHRKSNRVETKDMAAFLDMSFGMSIPGFDALVPKRVHVQPEGERKRARGMAPRATRLRGAIKDE